MNTIKNLLPNTELTLAGQHDLLLAILYHVLGLELYPRGIGNFFHLLNTAETNLIIRQWSDQPLVHHFAELTRSISLEPKFLDSCLPIPHDGGAEQNRKQYRFFQHRTFLLTLLTHPLPHSSHSSLTTSERHRLRLWLVVQACIRLIAYDNPSDKYISNAARFLVLDASDPRWQAVDFLLERTNALLGQASPSFDRFNMALAHTTEALRTHAFFSGHREREFLAALSRVARGESEPFDTGAQAEIILPPSGRDLLSSLHSNRRLHPAVIDGLEPVYLSNGLDDYGLAYVAEVDPEASIAEQRLASGSIYIQTMAASHYLLWDWDRILPVEEEQLFAWLAAKLESSKSEDSLGAVCIWLALQLGRSLAMIEQIVITDRLLDEWGISPDFNLLKRTRPMRSSAWKPDEIQKEKIATFSDELKLKIPRHIQIKLAQVAGETSQEEFTIAQLWKTASSEKLDAWFREQARRHFPRVTSAMLASYLSQRAFNRTGQQHFSRLLTSHPRSALPGACSYASWDIKAIENGLAFPVESAPDADENLHVMGSLLVPLEDMLKAEVLRCTSLLQQASEKGLTYYHNLLSQYVVMAVYAATGARPLRDPFGTFADFSFEYKAVYINDKSSPGGGRLVPLAEKVVTLLQAYIEHLRGLIEATASHRPELAEMLFKLTEGEFDPGIPLFFLLDEHLRWHSMADADHLECALFDWGLPANLFRHRFSQQLLLEGVHPEVIDAWMGHSERGVATYSDYSPRCWMDDAVAYRPDLSYIFDVLGFALPPMPEVLSSFTTPVNPASSYVEPEQFGEKQRALNRRARLKQAIADARLDTKLFLHDREISGLTDPELLELSGKMLHRENGLPHPQAALRYRIFLKLLQRSDSDGGNEGDKEAPKTSPVKRQLLKQRVVQHGEEASLLSADVLQALHLYQQLEDCAAKIMANTLKGRLGQAVALSISSVLLAIDKRMGYQRLIEDVAQGIGFRVIQDGARCFLEYTEGMRDDDFDLPVQRHEVSYKVASLLAHGLHQKKAVGVRAPEEVTELGPLVEIYRIANLNLGREAKSDFLAWLCHVINQANLVLLPGIIAGGLSGRVAPTSPSLRDQVRLLTGKSLDLPSAADADVLPSTAIPRALGPDISKKDLHEHALQYSKEVLDELLCYEPSKSSQHVKEIRKISHAYLGKTSTAMLMLGHWMGDLIEAGKGRKGRKHQPYARNSLTTYWGSLASVFRGLLYEVDLVALDSEDLTSLCEQMLEYKQLNSSRSEFFGKRLQDFFRWAKRFGVATPDWSELAMTDELRVVSPGLISESEYQACLQLLQSDDSLVREEQLMLSFVLLLTYRFGLRLREATGLLRSDWCQYGGHTWVLVQNNRFRTLKSKAGRRPVPLLFELSDIESEVIEQVLGCYESIAGDVQNLPILCEPLGAGKQPALSRIEPRVSPSLIAVLRTVTGNPTHVVHHARHTFYNRIAVALFGLETPLALKLTPLEEQEKIRQIVLGPVSDVSRRSAMALARLMGHRFPSTGLKSYFHLATEWADQLTPVAKQRVYELEKAVQVKNIPTLPCRQVETLGSYLRFQEPTLASTLQCLRLVALGMGYERAGTLMQLAPQYTARLQDVFEATNDRMRFNVPGDKKTKIKGDQCPNALLESITPDAWQRMLHRANELSESQLCLELESSERTDLLDLPYLVGSNRELLIERSGHCKLVKLVLDLFEVPNDAFRALTKSSSVISAELLEQAGFATLPESETKSKLARMDVCRRGHEYQVQDYAGLVLTRQAEGVLRSGLDAAVVFLACGVLLIHC